MQSRHAVATVVFASLFLGCNMSRGHLDIDPGPYPPPPPTQLNFTTTGSMSTGRNDHTATLLPDGKVLVAGGWDDALLVSAELYDPSTGTFTPTGGVWHGASLTRLRCCATGRCWWWEESAGGTRWGSAELYDPITRTFTATGCMAATRWGHTATLLPTGKVLVAGGGIVKGATSPVRSSTTR